MAVNTTGTFFGLKYAVPALRKARGGSIVNLSLIAGIIGSEDVHVACNASTAAVWLMTESVAAQHAKDCIRANSVHPGDHAADVHLGADRRSGDPGRSHAVHSNAPAERGGRDGECYPVPGLR
jgi:NAD(P)-dependent dehydrogenase (short-subunit alcohol dehydrogenase family)